MGGWRLRQSGDQILEGLGKVRDGWNSVSALYSDVAQPLITAIQEMTNTLDEASWQPPAAARGHGEVSGEGAAEMIGQSKCEPSRARTFDSDSNIDTSTMVCTPLMFGFSS